MFYSNNLPMVFFTRHDDKKRGIPLIQIVGVSEYEDGMSELETPNGKFVVKGTVKQTILNMHRTALIWNKGEWDWDLGTETI